MESKHTQDQNEERGTTGGLDQWPLKIWELTVITIDQKGLSCLPTDLYLISTKSYLGEYLSL